MANFFAESYIHHDKFWTTFFCLMYKTFSRKHIIIIIIIIIIILTV